MDEARQKVEQKSTSTGSLVEREQLNKIFADFNRVAEALDDSYQVLEERVSSLKRELSETRLAHRWDQDEKNRLANRLASLVSVLPNAVLVLNKQGLIIDRNPLASQVLNEPLIGLSWNEVMKREAVSDCSSQNEIVLDDGRIFSVARDGLAVSSDTAVFLTDVTDIHRTQSEMARNKRLTEMGEMASSMAHQIRTPLSAAHLYMSPLSRADIGVEERAETVARVQGRLSHIGKLIDSMLGFVRGSRKVVKQIQLQDILDMVSNFVASDVESFGADLRISHDDSNINIQADVEALVGALANIVLNAFEMSIQSPQKANRNRPEVLIDACVLEKTGIEIRIKDKGPGIDSDKLERIFDPFYTTRSTGTGLGLAIAAMTCKEHGGSIYAQNQAEGGAEFVIRLPVTNMQQSRVENELNKQKSFNKRIQREVA